MSGSSASHSVTRRHVLSETTVFAALCLADMGSTIYLIGTGQAVEANPLLAPWFRFGYLGFALAKIISFLLPLTLIELLRPKRPQFCTLVLRFGIVLYVAVYVFGSLMATGLINR